MLSQKVPLILFKSNHCLLIAVVGQRIGGGQCRMLSARVSRNPLQSHLAKVVCCLGWFKILIFWSWDLNTSHLIWTALMIISSYSEDFCHLLPLRASHRKFSGTVGDIENRTSPNPPFMGIQTSVCGHWSQRCSGVLTCFCPQKRQKTMKNDYFPENSHFLQFFSIFRY